MHNYPAASATYPLYGSPQAPSFRDLPPFSVESKNRYIYVNQNCANTMPSFYNKGLGESTTSRPRVLVNPHFHKKVYVNPNFQAAAPRPSTSTKILVNPNIARIPSMKCTSKSNIHVNPCMLNHLQLANEYRSHVDRATYKTVTERRDERNSSTKQLAHLENLCLSRKTVKEEKRVRRSSIHSKYKIIKSTFIGSNKEVKNEQKRKPSFQNKYKLIKCETSAHKRVTESPSSANKYKLDNRRDHQKPKPRNKTFVYMNRFLNVKDLAKIVPLKNKKLSIANNSGTVHRKLLTSRSYLKNQVISKSKYKFVRRSTTHDRSSKSTTRLVSRHKISTRKLSISTNKNKHINYSSKKRKKCNVPCHMYRKYGKCKAHENGKCTRKHDPAQIALCMKFLQGACINKKCPLSHNVSPEKMPTCKYYLEGNCSRDECPYLHVRINPKADICKDFLEGFCKKATQCDKRHQFLCPDYEKNGRCPKPRCSYPHGQMVRKYSVFDKLKFTKKCSNVNKISENKIGDKMEQCVIDNKADDKNDINVKTRYYIEQGKIPEEIPASTSVEEGQVLPKNGFLLRPQLGELPSFIALNKT